jgi:hypothetical protein
MKRAGHRLHHGMAPLLHSDPNLAMDVDMDFISLLRLYAELGRADEI